MRVRGEDCVGEPVECLRPARSRTYECGNRGMNFLQRQLHADDPRGRWEHPMRTELELLCHSDAYAGGGPEPLFSSGAVGIAGVHNQRPYLPLSPAQMLAPNRDRRRDNLI